MTTESSAKLKEKLAKDNTESAASASAMVMAGLHSNSLIKIDLPLDRARENLILFKATIEDKDAVKAKGVLAEVEQELDADANAAGETDRKAMSALRAQMSELSSKLLRR